MSNSLLEFDKKHLWHPYTSIDNPLPVYPVQSAQGVRIELMDGRILIDGMSSWWAAIHGYGHPALLEPLKKQADQLSHIMFGGLTHEPAVMLGKKLVEYSPKGLERVFLCDSGSVAVEVAMKMALQYSFSQHKEKKKKFLTIRSGYHGDTFHAMSVCDPVKGMHQIYSGILPQFHFADRPDIRYGQQWNSEDITSFAGLISQHHEELCAVILEPIVQGAGGMWFYHPQYLKEVRDLCDAHDVLLICDEIATGFGRTGRLFGCDHAEISPDIMCLGKALTGGYLTLAAVLTRAEVGRGISENPPHVFMHGPTFMGNPLACRVAIASLDLLENTDWQANVLRLERGLELGLAHCRDFKQVADVRILGGIGVVELHKPVDLASIQERFVERGVWVRPFGTLVYLMPPYCMNNEDLALLTGAVCEVVKELN
ncbi:unnamed protein product [Cyprideis torosa]|uniref:Uncharacterized protein n=1 Tax=Cyprideis torosa TaxID=163714 RepID=A0A7R8ZS58_9CRUS|nr:unnamed protein product [Cyprideis torosa]CAG0906137.1 unnamed protein product [Cyprideis torosa]